MKTPIEDLIKSMNEAVLSEPPVKCATHEHWNIIKNCPTCYSLNCGVCCKKCGICNKKICYFCSYIKFAVRNDNMGQAGVYCCFDCKDNIISDITKFNIKEEYIQEYHISETVKATTYHVLTGDSLLGYRYV